MRFSMKNVRMWFYLLVCIFLFNGCGTTISTETTTGNIGGEMVTLGIDLQDGFDQDTVIVILNGDEIFQESDISYKLLYGFTGHSILKEVEPGLYSIELIVLTRNIQTTIDLEIMENTYIGISVIGGEIITTEPQNEPFFYG